MPASAPGAPSAMASAFHSGAGGSSLCVAPRRPLCHTPRHEHQGARGLMRISYSGIWEDTVRLIRAHASLAAALAGVLLFLPALLIGHFVPMPEVTEADQMVRAFTEHFRANFHWMILSAVLSAAGTLSILFLVFRGGGTSVGAAIAAAVGLLSPPFPAVGVARRL